jgi:hypothetical protein
VLSRSRCASDALIERISHRIGDITGPIKQRDPNATPNKTWSACEYQVRPVRSPQGLAFVPTSISLFLHHLAPPTTPILRTPFHLGEMTALVVLQRTIFHVINHLILFFSSYGLFFYLPSRISWWKMTFVSFSFPPLVHGFQLQVPRFRPVYI